MKLNIYVLSDSLGNTGEKVAKACLAQFDYSDWEIRKYARISEDILEDVLDECKRENSIIIYSVVTKEMSEKIKGFAERNNIASFDIIGGIIDEIEERLKMKPIREAGIIRRMDEEYFKRVEAMEFAVRYDDGKDPRGLKKADVVLIGISRTSKTPLSMYLANRNIKVVNVPLVPEAMPPKELKEISSSRIIGLINSPEKLNQIREERLQSLGMGKGASYSSMTRILEELDYAERIMKKIGCPIIDVSNKAIEETADIIIDILKKQQIYLNI